ncbi:hypothetical protein [Pontibacter mucosus]|uniref:hypothetical protein n=1 Tax=Pontibacter mucosus TaxID=1649266 RepID=UPI0011B213E4|nr:hypothetical protein [Pontibacter mucosus]
MQARDIRKMKGYNSTSTTSKPLNQSIVIFSSSTLSATSMVTISVLYNVPKLYALAPICLGLYSKCLL